MSANARPRLIPTIADPVRPDPEAARCYGGRPAWTARELQVIRERYPAGGAPACASLLPERTANAIIERARKLGVRHLRRYVKQAPSNDVLDAAIRRLYAKGRPRNGAAAEFCRHWARSRQWVRARAIQLGAIAPMGQFRPWTADEERVLLDAIDHSARTAQKRLIEIGITDRTEPAIAERMRRLRRIHGLERDGFDPDLFSGNELERLMGVEHRAIARWIKLGWLPAKVIRDAHGVVLRYEIRRGPLREFLIAHPAEWHPGKCDRYWLVEILTGRCGVMSE